MKEERTAWKFSGDTIKYGKSRSPEYMYYNSVVVSIDGKDLVFEFIPTKYAKQNQCKKKIVTLKNFRSKTALRAITSFPGYPKSMPRFFEDAIKTVYHDLGLTIGSIEPVLKDLV